MLQQKTQKISPLPPAERGFAGGKCFLRIFLVLALISVIVFGSCFTASAYVVDSGVEGVDNFKVEDITIGVFDSSGNIYEVRSITDVTGNEGYHSERGIQLNVTTVKNFKYGETLSIVVGMQVTNDSYVGGDYLVSGSYNVGLSNDNFGIYSTLNNNSTDKKPYCRKYNRTLPDNGGYQYNYYMEGTLSYFDTETTEYATSTFPPNKLGDKYNYYVTKLTVDSWGSGFNNFNIALYDFNFNVYDPATGKMEEVKVTIEESTDKLISNQNENTDKIINEMQEAQERERNEAQETGDESVDEVAGEVPDYSENLLSVFSKLTKSMCHTHTGCGFEFPGIKIPKIGSLIPQEIVLLEKQWIGVDVYFNSLERGYGSIIQIVRSVLSVALILYCFKEMYSLIQYVLTLRGGGVDE